MNDTTRQVGGAVGVALLGSILASAFRPRVRDLLSGHVPGSLLGRVEDSLGSALGVARDVPAARPYAPRIVSAAQTSFVSGMHAAVLVAAAIAVIGGIGVVIWLPGARPRPPRRCRRDRAEPGGRRGRRAHSERDTSWRVMVMRWISLVPSPMQRRGASR